MVIDQRRRAGHEVFVLSPKDASVGFNVLDWIGRFGGTKEEDVVAVAGCDSCATISHPLSPRRDICLSKRI